MFPVPAREFSLLSIPIRGFVVSLTRVKVNQCGVFLFLFWRGRGNLSYTLMYPQKSTGEANGWKGRARNEGGGSHSDATQYSLHTGK